MSFDWYKRYPKKALRGMRNLTLEQRGAYNTILDLIYAKGGPIDEDYPEFAGMFKIDVKRAKLIVRQLISLGKLYRTKMADGAPGLMNETAALTIYGALIVNEAKAKGAKERWASKKINDLDMDNQSISFTPASTSLLETLEASRIHPGKKDSDSQDKALEGTDANVVPLPSRNQKGSV
jgi:hypothetical protein